MSILNDNPSFGQCIAQNPRVTHMKRVLIHPTHPVCMHGWDLVLYIFRPIGRGVRGGSSEPPLLASKRFYTLPSYTFFKCPTICKWFTGLAAIPNEFRCSYICTLRNAHKRFTLLRWEDARVNTCAAISGAREFTSRPSSGSPPTILSLLFCQP